MTNESLVVADLPIAWRTLAATLTEYGATVQADALTRCAAELETALHATPVLLNLKDAAATCGYSADHLGRLVKAGVIRNFGKAGGRPLVRPQDLPRKATAREPQVTDVPSPEATRAAFRAVGRRTIRQRGAA